MVHWRKKIGWVCVAILVSFVGWAYFPTITHPKINLAFQIEGALSSKLNFRDAGDSINQCLGREVLPRGKLLRASGFFSGWSCENVGNPDVIYSLNFSEAENKRHYCRASDGLRIGVSYQIEELNDIEFLDNWTKKPKQTKNVCAFIIEGDKSFKQGKSMLYHCEAGRDRTGAVIAIMAAKLLEEAGSLSDEHITAIECDYRKSSSLKSEKYGRIATMLKSMREEGGVSAFIKRFCHVEG